MQPDQKVGGGRFTLVKPLGRGGMGEVWLARDERLQEQVALKFLPPEIRGDPAALDDLRRETVRSHKLSHPNIVRIHDLHEDPDGTAFIVMEYIDGPTLAALRLQQPARVLSWGYLRPLVEQLCAALDYAHCERVIHRDLKPANMMVDSKGRLKLADFGIAAVGSDSMSRISVKNRTSGTLPYMSPQQINGERPSVSDDIYALGVTLYELLTSTLPFYSGDITHQILHKPPEPIEDRLAALEIQNSVPADVAALVMACLAKEPQDRPLSAQVVAGWIGLEVLAKPSTEKLASEFFPQTPSNPEAAAEGELAGYGLSKPPGYGRMLAAVAIVVLVMAWAFWLRQPGHRSETSIAPVTAKVAAQTEPARELKAPPVGAPPKVAGMALIPAGAFTMGDALDGDRGGGAIPSIVMVSGFYMDVNLVSYSQWQSVYNWAARHEFRFLHAGAGKAANHPVQTVDWYDCVKWCNARSQQAGLTAVYYADAGLTQVYTSGEGAAPYVNWTASGFRLPTEAEWEKAARGGLSGQRFPWGNTISESQANYRGTAMYSYDSGPKGYNTVFASGAYPYTSPVGCFAANGYGLYDMAGNVYEWCWDWYGTPYGQPTTNNPTGPATESIRVLRGGSWLDFAGTSRCAYRHVNYPYVDFNYIGFRCVRGF